MADSTPICRCRVLYLGSAVPRQSKDGLQGIQEPLQSLYPAEGALGAKGIDSWLSVWSNGILLENVDENLKKITRFFPIESLHYCAAVRQVFISERGNYNPEPKFLPLDSPFAKTPRAQHPPIFAAILRRTTGIKVLECHVFICKREAAANALVRCCFHAYADNSYAHQLESCNTASSMYGTLKSRIVDKKSNEVLRNVGPVNQQIIGSSADQRAYIRSRVGSTTTLNSFGQPETGDGASGINMSGGGNNAVEGYTPARNFYGSSADLSVGFGDVDPSLLNGDENHKIWNGSQDCLENVDLEDPYEVFSSNVSTLGRPTRARQISAPVAVPPPPMKEEKKKIKKSNKSSGCESFSGLSENVIKGPRGNKQTFRNYHTISHREMPHDLLNAVGYNHVGMVPTYPQLMQTQTPIKYMIPQQFATLQPSGLAKRPKKDKKSNGVAVGMPIVPPIYAYRQPLPQKSVVAQPLIGDLRPLALSNQKLAASVGNGLGDSINPEAELAGGTGIYKRKGHLNERAFSYSIRQEHRSRSHGSLASLQFNPPDMKKECEIAQMVAGLDLKDSDDHQTNSKLQRKATNSSNEFNHNHHQQHQQIYGNKNLSAYYGNVVEDFGETTR